MTGRVAAVSVDPLHAASAAYLRALTRGDTAEADRLERVLDAATVLDKARRNAPDRIMRAAHIYAGHGYRVFPVQPKGKRPLTRHGFKDATADHTRIAEWWARWPDANVALPTGGRFDVIDVDGVDGILALWGGTPCVADGLTVLGHAHTARVGGHHLYVPVTGHANQTANIPGVDYRGVGGYVVAPPSVGPNGNRYEWHLPLRPETATAYPETHPEIA